MQKAHDLAEIMNKPSYEFCQNIITVLNVALIIVMTDITQTGGVDTF